MLVDSHPHHHLQNSNNAFHVYKAHLVRHRRSQECLQKHENSAAFQTVLKSIASKNPTPNHHYVDELDDEPSPLTPVECQHQPLSSISPDMPINERALCGFRYVENFNAKRIPKSITEVQCLCNKPKSFHSNIKLLCEPLYYDIPVLKFDEECEVFKEEVERIALACLPTFGSFTASNGNVLIGHANKAGIDV